MARPDLLRSTEQWLLVAMTLATQVTMWGIGFWLLRFRSMSQILGFLAIVAMCVIVVAVWNARQSLSPMHLAGAALLLALVGVVLSADAYRRWLRTDLD